MKVIKKRTLVAMLHDIIVVVSSFYLSISLRHGEFIPLPFSNFEDFFKIITTVTILQFFSLRFMGVYKAIIRFSSIQDLVRLIKGSIIAVPLSFAALFFLNRLENIHRTSFLINWVFLIVGLSFGRLADRIFKDNAVYKIKRKKSVSNQRVIIVGAGIAGERLLREVQANPNIHLNVIGLVDDDLKINGKFLRGIEVLGPTQNLKQYIENYAINKIIIAIPSASSDVIKRIISTCIGKNIQIKILPKISDLIGEGISYSNLRNIEPEDLLGRKAHNLDILKMSSFISGKRILVTGAGGSIGSELCIQISQLKPTLIILYEVTELFLYELEQRITQTMPDIEIKCIIGDVRNVFKLKDVFETFRPEIVFHAAAYKHVPLMEQNPMESIKTNVIGTENVANVASDYGAEKFILISSDKAINPTNVMGASKRIAELICQHIQQKSYTKFITVRFGNVLGSSGSVIPAFKKQIEKGGPVLVTHPEIKRYFMSIPEATQLVIQAGSLGEGGEIMVLDMGEPIKILDLAYEMIRFAGLEPGIDIEIKFSGLRPGEKLFEELFHAGDNIKETKHPLVKIATTNPPQEHFNKMLEYLKSLPENVDSLVIKDAVKNIVPEYIFERTGTEHIVHPN